MSSHPYSSQQALFKAYDIRGKRTLFTNTFVWDLSRVFATDILNKINLSSIQKSDFKKKGHKAPTVVIGYDMRHGSLEIAEKFAYTFSKVGIHVIWIGLVTTPIMAFWAHQYEGHGLIATASHSEGHINGLKWLINGESPSTLSIQKLYQQMRRLKTKSTDDHTPNPPHVSLDNLSASKQITVLDKSTVSEQYINSAVYAIEQVKQQSGFTSQLSATSNTNNKRRFSTALKIVIDCLNGATGLYAKDFFLKHSNLCREVIVINDSPDGNFPKGNPDPTESGRLEELSAAVLTHNADIGIAFDGDGDRLMIVDNQGKVIAPDHLLYLLALVALDGVGQSNDFKNKTVIFDVKCSHHLTELIKQLGATPQMSKTGSSLMRRALQTADESNPNQALFAGELSGHFLFNDGYFTLHDDAMYAALRLIYWLTLNSNIDTKQQFIDDSIEKKNSRAKSQTPICLSYIIDQLPEMVSTSDVYLPLTVYKVKSQVDSSDENALLVRLSNLCQTLQKSCLGNDNTQHFNKYCQASLIDQASKFGLPKNTRLTTIDGIRLDFPNGFGVIRKSNTSNCLTVRFAGNSLADLQNIQHHFAKLCQSLDSNLAQHIANIRATA